MTWPDLTLGPCSGLPVCGGGAAALNFRRKPELDLERTTDVIVNKETINSPHGNKNTLYETKVRCQCVNNLSRGRGYCLSLSLARSPLCCLCSVLQSVTMFVRHNALFVCAHKSKTLVGQSVHIPELTPNFTGADSTFPEHRSFRLRNFSTILSWKRNRSAPRPWRSIR